MGGSRNYLKSFLLLESISGKSAAIESEHLLGLQLFSQDNQSGIGKIHRDIAIFFHQGCDPSQARRGGRDQLKRASQEKLKTNFLSLPLRPNEVKRLGQSR